MQGVVMVTTQRHGELIAHLAPQRGWLSKFEMMRVGWRALADQARLRGDESEMNLASSADGLAYRRYQFRRSIVAGRTVSVSRAELD